MFKKLKDKIEEEFKQAPLKFPVSVQQLAQVISPSQSVNSLSDNNASSSLTYPTDVSNVSNDFFSIGGDDDPQDGTAKMPLTLHSVDLTATSPSNMTQNMSRSRRSSLSSVTSEASSLFPIYESGLNQNFFQSDLESEMEDGMSGQIEKISKEQLYQSFKKILNRYNKYKGRYTDLMKHCKELQHDNFKTKNVLQESQDKALRRIAELREQCQLEQKAKAHLEESLRNDVEERDHIINTLKTKISLLSNGTESGQLIDLEVDSSGAKLEDHPQSKELWDLKSQNEELQKEVERLKKIKETACNLIHRCDTTINEATEDIKSDNIKQKMSELKSDIQKMKLENESLSHLLSRNIITEDDRKSQASMENSLIGDLSGLEYGQGDQKPDEKDKKIEKLNNLLLKCKEKINGLTAELKAKDIIIEDSNKQLKELKEQVGAFKTREEENALSVAENKKAIHEELSAKEEQIKALTKELKTKENEFIKEKAEVIKNFEDKIRSMTSDFTKEMKRKNEQNEKLQEDLKAREIVSGTLEKVKSIEESFGKMLEFVRARSLDFEELAKSKTEEIEKAQQRLEEKLTTARKNLTELLQNAQKSKLPERIEEFTQQKLFELHSEIKNPSLEPSENFHIVEKLKSDVINLSKKLEILESELEESKKDRESERQEKDKWRERHAVVEGELEKVKKEFQEKLSENAELDKALTDRNEKIKKVENEKKLLQKVSTEKVETESKLREYIENYNKLEKENQTLQNDLVERCGKLLKELNENKEKIKTLENQEKARTNELEEVRNQYSKDEKVRSEENQRLKDEVETLKSELNERREEVEKLRTSVEEGEALRDKLKQKETELEKLEERTKELENDLANAQKEISEEKRSSEAIHKELEELRNNLKLESKEKDENSILADKLSKQCNFLLGEMENLKKNHGKVEEKVMGYLEAAKKEVLEKDALVQKLQEELEQVRKENESSTTGAEELRKKFETIAEEAETLRQQQAEAKQTNDDLRNLMSENEAVRQELNDRISELTNEKNEIFGDLQVKLSEIEALRNGLKSVREELAEKTKAFEEEKVRLMSENENKLNILKNEIKFINTKHEEDIGNFEENLNSEMKEVSEKMEIAEKTSAELLEKLEKITSERDELKMAEEEKNLKISELESCLKALKTELDEKFNDDAEEEKETAERHGEEIKKIIIQYDKEIAERDEEIETLQMRLSSEEETNSNHREEVKEIILRYDKEIAERDEEIEALKSKLSGYDDTLELLKTTREELKILKKELAEKDNVVEEKVEEAVQLKEDKQKSQRGDDVEGLKSSLKQLERSLEEQKAETERAKAEKELILAQEKTKWEEKVAELNRELKALTSQKKVNTEKSGIVTEPECLEEVELECTSKVAVTPLESGLGSVELLQKQLIQQAEEMKELKKQHKREIIELKKTSMSRRRGRKNSSENQDWLTGGGLENDTEHEYLRNILYEYMMGKEQLVLAKVLSAIVKFNEEQTHNVLEKEHQRQTLLGQLGLL